jgi:polar amino acid transport system substrate-binding protein
MCVPQQQLMKKFLLFLSLISVILFVFAACAPQAPATKTDGEISTPDTDSSWSFIKDKGKITLGLDDTFAPMGFRDESGKIIGFDIDLAEAVGTELGVKVEYQPIDWAAKEFELNSKRIDVVWNGMSITSERQETMLLSKPYLNNTIVIMAKAGTVVNAKEELIGKKVGTQSASAALEMIEADLLYADLKDNLVEYKDYDEAVMDLEIGRIDAVIIDKVTGMYKASKKPGAYIFAKEDFGEDLYAVGFRKEDKAFYEEFQKAFDKVISSGKGSEISKKWFNEDIVVKK